MISISLLLSIIFGMSIAIGAERGKWSARDVYYGTRIEAGKVPGAERHTMYLLEGKGISFIDGEGAIACVMVGTLDYNKGEGPTRGYTYYTFPDGSTVTTQYTSVTKAGGPGMAGGAGGESSWTFVSGTGKFEGITGGGKGKYWIVAPGQWYSETEGDYTLP